MKILITGGAGFIGSALAKKLIEDRDLRGEMGKKAREKVLANYTTKNSKNEEYYAYLRSRIMDDHKA